MTKIAIEIENENFDRLLSFLFDDLGLDSYEASELLGVEVSLIGNKSKDCQDQCDLFFGKVFLRLLHGHSSYRSRSTDCHP